MVTDSEVEAIALRHGIRVESESHLEMMREELMHEGMHELPETPAQDGIHRMYRSLYAMNDFSVLQDLEPQAPPYQCLHTLDDLLKKDEQREKDGFPRKISIGRAVKPSSGGGDGKVVVVPTATEEKFIHDPRRTQRSDEGGGDGDGEGEGDSSDSGGESGGSGEGEEGDVIGEQPIHEEGGEGDSGAGSGEGANHDLESEAYDIGKILSEHFSLPNLEEKGKKRTINTYTYDLTDMNRGEGQVLNKKETLKEILKTNIGLHNVDPYKVDPASLIINPKDFVYHLLSEEKQYESQAMVFFVRDYSGSMNGPPTQSVVHQHLLIYSWLQYQYDKKVESRFILHDTDVREAEDFYEYYNRRVAGGTKVAPAFEHIYSAIENEGLARDYNIYIFYGGDGGDWDRQGDYAIPAIEKTLPSVNRLGVTIAKNNFQTHRPPEMEDYLTQSGLLEKYEDRIRLDSFVAGAEEQRLIDGIKELLAENGHT